MQRERPLSDRSFASMVATATPPAHLLLPRPSMGRGTPTPSPNPSGRRRQGRQGLGSPAVAERRGHGARWGGCRVRPGGVARTNLGERPRKPAVQAGFRRTNAGETSPCLPCRQDQLGQQPSAPRRGVHPANTRLAHEAQPISAGNAWNDLPRPRPIVGQSPSQSGKPWPKPARPAPRAPERRAAPAAAPRRHPFGGSHS